MLAEHLCCLTSSGASMQVLAYNFPDPGVKLMNGKYYAYGTNGGKGNIQAATSTDMVRCARATTYRLQLRMLQKGARRCAS